MTAPVVITTRHMPATDVLPARIRARSGGRSLVVPRDDASPDPHASAAAQLASIIMGRILELVDVRRTGDVTRGYRFEVDPDPRIGEVSGPCTVCGRDDIVTGLGDEPRCSRHADYGQATDNDDETQAYAAQREADLMAAAETLSHPDGAP